MRCEGEVTKAVQGGAGHLGMALLPSGELGLEAEGGGDDNVQVVLHRNSANHGSAECRYRVRKGLLEERKKK